MAGISVAAVGAGADYHDRLVRVVEIVRPFLRVNDEAFVFVEIRPFRRVAFGMAIITLTHPEEIRGETQRVTGVGSDGVDGPEIFCAGPVCPGNCVPVADVLVEPILLDYLANIGQNFPRPWRLAGLSTA